jgi:hypothetical protein
MKKASICFILSIVLFGCAAQLTEEGRMVRQIITAQSEECEFLGVVEASEKSGLEMSDLHTGAFNRLRNEIARLGGNAYVHTITASSARTKVQADAYKCPY